MHIYSITLMEIIKQLTRHLDIVISVDAVLSSQHNTSVIASIHKEHIRYFKLYPAVILTFRNSTFQ